MRALKSILRWFLAIQAAGLLLIPLAGVIGILGMRSAVGSHAALTHARSGSSALFAYSLLAAMFVVGTVFAMAWWSTRIPRATPSAWALAASALNVVQGIAIAWVSHIASASHVRSSSTAWLWFIGLGAAGLFVFSRPETAPDPAIRSKSNPIAGDRTSLWTRHAVTTLSVVAQIAALLFWTRWAMTQHLLGFHGLSWIILVSIASIVTTVVHECGHAVMAWCFEMGLLSFKAGPFQAVRREGKWRFKFHAAGLVTPGGAVGAVPTRPGQPRWEEIVMIAAGPVANLLIGAAAIWAVLHDRWGSYQQSWELIAYTGAFCLIAALLNLVPFLSEDGGYSDGARILQIVTRSPLDDYHRVMASILSGLVTARRYCDLDVAQIERAALLFPNEFRGLHLMLCACHVYEDTGRLREASAALAAAEDIYNRNSIDLPGPLHTIFIIGQAWLNRDAAAARLWWNRMEAKKIERENVDFWLAKAALLWIEGKPNEAEDAWQNANLDAESLPEFGAYEFDRHRCALLREAFYQAPPAVVPVSTALPVAAPAIAIPAPAPARVVAAPPEVIEVEPIPVRVIARIAAIAPTIAIPEAVPALNQAPVLASGAPVPAVRVGENEATPARVGAAPVSDVVSVSEPELVAAPVVERVITPVVESTTESSAGATLQAATPVPFDSPARIYSPLEAEPVASVFDPLARIIPPPISQEDSLAARPVPSSTRIPVAALKSALPKIALQTVSPPQSDDPSAAKPKTVAVPAAFARRPRLAPLPPGAQTPEPPFSFESPDPADTLNSAIEPILESEPVSSSQPTTVLANVPAFEAPPEKPRHDPFEFIRAKAIENLNANPS